MDAGPRKTAGAGGPGAAELIGKLTLNGRWLSSPAEMREQLAILAELTPQWCSLVTAGEQPAVRLDPSVRFAEVMRIVKKAAEEAALEAARAPGNAARGDGELRV